MTSDRNKAVLKALGYISEDDQTEAQPVEAEAQPDPLDDHRIHAAKVNGLPVELADRLTGGSQAEVTLDAQRLAKALEAPTVNRGELEALGRDRQQQQADVDALMPPQSGQTDFRTD
jgi:hypothetical protein